MNIGKRLLPVILLVSLLIIGGNASADFNLIGDDHLDVTTTHTTGRLYDTSSAEVIEGGYVGTLEAYGTSSAIVNAGFVYLLNAYGSSTTSVSVGTVGTAFFYNASTITVAGGKVDAAYGYADSQCTFAGGAHQYVYARDRTRLMVTGGSIEGVSGSNYSAINVSGGTVRTITTRDYSTMSLTGGNVSKTTATQDSNVVIDGANVALVETLNRARVTINQGHLPEIIMYPTYSGLQSVTVAGGTVGKVTFDAHLVSTNLQIAARPEDINLAALGLHTASEAVGDVSFRNVILSGCSLSVSGSYAKSLNTQGGSNLITGGAIGLLNVSGFCQSHISDGRIESLVLSGSSTTTIEGGSFGSVGSYLRSVVDITGGSVESLFARGTDCTVTLYAYGFEASQGLTVSEFSDVNGFLEYRITGNGTLSGRWLDGLP